jgi:hypothetical protein
MGSTGSLKTHPCLWFFRACRQGHGHEQRQTNRQRPRKLSPSSCRLRPHSGPAGTLRIDKHLRTHSAFLPSDMSRERRAGSGHRSRAGPLGVAWGAPRAARTGGGREVHVHGLPRQSPRAKGSLPVPRGAARGRTRPHTSSRGPTARGSDYRHRHAATRTAAPAPRAHLPCNAATRPPSCVQSAADLAGGSRPRTVPPCEESTNFLGELKWRGRGQGTSLGQLGARGWETAGASLGPDRGVRGPKVRGRHSGVEAPPAA